MPPMTMGFRVASPKIQEAVSVGDEVRFTLRGMPPNVAVTAIEKISPERGRRAETHRIVPPGRDPALPRRPPARRCSSPTRSPTRSRSSTPAPSRSSGRSRSGPGKPNRVVFHPGRPDGVGRLRQEPRPRRDRRRGPQARQAREDRRQSLQPRLHPDGRHLLVLDWASDTSTDEVIFYDLKAEKIDGRVEVSTWPAHAIFSRDGKLLYVSGETAGDVTVIDVAHATVVARHVHGGGDAMGLALRTTARRSMPPPARTRRSSRSTPPRTRRSARSRCRASSTRPR